tara:strand:+ start:355 stop:942 length:588 start_codon:yes stop_codon:yes gene_type:complete
MSSKTDFYSSYLIQQKELYGNSLYINHISDDISNIINSCIKCHGNPKSDIIFIGYDSFMNESEDGISFVNKSNQLFEKILDAISLSVNDIIQVNLIKVFFKNDKVYKIEENFRCLEHLDKLIKFNDIRLIVVLGQETANFLLKNELSLDQMRKNEINYKNIHLLTTYHPSSLLMDENLKKQCWEDFKKIKKYYNN